MTSSQNTAMDVDSPAGTLKRCSSAPMINDNSSTGMTTSSPPASAVARETGIISILGASNPTRPRRFSASSSPLSAGSPVRRLTPRISQLRQEECVDVNNSRELAHEREIHHTMQISQSWEDLRLVSDSQKPNKMSPLNLQLNLPNFGGNYCNSPSPSRLTQCSSPGVLSPTRISLTRRSASPVLRPSTLGKRKLDDKLDFHGSPRAKRMSYGNERGGGLLTTSSPLPGSLSSIGTPESISSVDSPSFQFRMMDSPSPSRPAIIEPMVVTNKQDHEMSEPPS